MRFVEFTPGSQDLHPRGVRRWSMRARCSLESQQDIDEAEVRLYCIDHHPLNLTLISLRDAMIGSETACAFAEALKVNATLRELR